MRKHLFYNEKKYVNSITRGESMNLDYILSSYNRASEYEISEEVSDFMGYIKTEPFYISPSFTDIKTDVKASTLNPKFILFSAPGATGKTALAKYISFTYNALYWNLAKIKIGDKSFAGSILEAVTDNNYTQFIKDLNAGNVYLVIDAFDEAEIISGRLMISRFIEDINKSLKSHSKATVFLLARTETAQFIASYCTDNSIPISHYEIGFFDEQSSKEFIVKSISENDNSTIPDEECADKYYNLVKSNITDKESKSFLGYAPVLQAISKHISSYNNRQKLISELTSQIDCVSLIMRIMDDLLSREQNDKMIPALKKNLEEKHPEFTEWDKVYSPKEQLIRVINFILFEDTKYDNYKLDFLPPQMVDEYQVMLDTFLRQHPFVFDSMENKGNTKSVDFTGPAFRDYTLAKIILDSETEEYSNVYFENSESELYFPSQIFFDCYMNLSNNSVFPAHISYVYDSFKAKATAYESFHLTCLEDSSQNGTKSYIATFEMIPGKKQEQIENTVEAKILMPEKPLVFEQLVNVTVDAPDLNVYIGRGDIACRASNASIVCNSITWTTSNITIEAFESTGCLLVSNKDLSGTNVTIDIASAKNLKVSAPNVNSYYKLIQYAFNFEDVTSGIDITMFTYALRCILFEFRAHRKDTLAKTADRIDFVVVGNSEIKKIVLAFLKSKGILYSADHLYKINEEKMQEIGIYFNALTNLDTKCLESAYSDFAKWNESDS